VKRRTCLAGALAGCSRLALPGAAVALSGCTDRAGPASDISVRGPTMGTFYRLKLRGDADDTKTLQSAIVMILDRVDRLMSTYRPDSELYAFNASGGDAWSPISADTQAVLGAATMVNAMTGGAFDVTIGPLVNLWGFGPSGLVNAPPSEEAIADAWATTGHAHLRTRTTHPTMRKTMPALSVDLCGIAKGYAVDLAAAQLDARGVENYLIEVGGELRGRGRRSDGSPWRIGIERPVPARRTVYRVLHLDGRAIATSGDYRNYYEFGGRRFSHTIDPRTARPITHALASVSVVADSTMQADALSTALMVLGPDEGFELARDEGVAALFISRSAHGFTEHRTPALAPHLAS